MSDFPPRPRKPRAMALFNRIVPHIAEIQRHQLCDGSPLSFVELFAGDAAVSKGLRLFGYSGLSFDMRYSELHNFLTPSGYLAALAAIMPIHVGGVVWMAPPCSTWVWVSRHSTKRARVPRRVAHIQFPTLP